MDFGATISRALKITWEHKILWILGFLVALGGGSAGNIGQNPQITNRFSSGQAAPPWLTNLVENPDAILGILVAVGCVVLIIGIILWVVGLIARGGLIAGVQQIETEGNTTFGSAWQAGAAKFWRLLGLDILIALPIIVIAIVLVIVFVLAFGGIFAASSGGSRASLRDILGVLGAAGIGIVCCLICVIVLYAILAQALRTFGDRAIVIENLGVTASLGRAWGVFKANLGNIILLALLMLVVSIVFGLVTGAVALVVLAPTFLPIIPIILGTSRSAVLTTGAIVLGVIGLIVVAILGAIIESVYITFNSAAWTLAYRQFIGMAPTTPAQPAAQPPLPAA